MFLEVLEGSGNPGRRPRVPASYHNSLICKQVESDGYV